MITRRCTRSGTPRGFAYLRSWVPPGERGRYPAKNETRMTRRTLQSRRSLVWAYSVCCLLLAGCNTPFGMPQSDVTTKPDARQVQYCRDVMYINPNTKITPLGYHYRHGFPDAAIAFKFVATSDGIDNIFLDEFVPPSKLIPRSSSIGLDHDIGQPWWDPKGKQLTGGNFDVPPPNAQGSRGLNIGILENHDKSFTVYIYWFET